MKKWTFSISRLYLIVSLAISSLFLMPACEESAVVPGLHANLQSEWLQMDSGTSENLRDVWGLDGEHVFAVGGNGTILFFNGVEWNRMDSGTTENLLSVWGCGMQTIYVTGENGTLLHFDGLHWAPIDVGTTETLRAIGGSYSEDCETGVDGPYILIGGPPGKILYYDFYSGWRTSSSESMEELLNLHIFTLDAYYSSAFVLCAVGRSGSVYTWYGPPKWSDQTWYKSETGITDDLFAVFGDAPGYVYTVADGGNIYQNTKQWMTDPPSGVWRRTAGLGGGKLYDIAARSYNDIFMVGAGPRIVHYDRQTFTPMRANAISTLRGIWADETDVFAVGDDGLILTYTDPPLRSTCPINVTISVTDETMPAISWTPECPVSKIFVEDWGGDGHGFPWFIAADGNFIESGVRYGTVPDNALEFCPAGALMEGGLYRVSLIRRDWNNEILIGSWNITPGDSQANGYMAVRKAVVRGPDDWLAQVSADPAGNYSYRKFYLLRLRQTIPGQQVFGYAGIYIVRDDWWRWIVDPAEREDDLNIRSVIVEKLVYDPDEGITIVISNDEFRAAQPNYSSDLIVIWDILKP
jgi:hypothetical protein